MGKRTAMKVYESKIVVQGSGSFPFDMLRYDSCFPWDEKDSNELARDDGARIRLVTLRRRSVNPSGATLDRWRSFGWQVVREEAGES